MTLVLPSMLLKPLFGIPPAEDMIAISEKHCPTIWLVSLAFGSTLSQLKKACANRYFYYLKENWKNSIFL